MISENIAAFGRSHDPSDSASRNVELAGFLRKVRGTFDSVSVFLDSSNTDTDLVISMVAYDEDTQRVSWRQTAGNRTNQALDGDGVTLRYGYRIVVRVFLTDGRHYDGSIFQTIADH